MEASQIQHGGPRRFVMSAPTPLRQDFDASQLRGLAGKTKDGPQARRLLALAARELGGAVVRPGRLIFLNFSRLPFLYPRNHPPTVYNKLLFVPGGCSRRKLDESENACGSTAQLAFS